MSAMRRRRKGGRITSGEAKKGDAPLPEGSSGVGGVPPGVVPLFLSGPGQQLFGCITDEDLTPDQPFKLIARERILEDFRNRAAVSDFHPIKKKIKVRTSTSI